MSYTEHLQKDCFCIGRNQANTTSYILNISINVYDSLVQPYFNYCSDVWGNCTSFFPFLVTSLSRSLLLLWSLLFTIGQFLSNHIKRGQFFSARFHVTASGNTLQNRQQNNLQEPEQHRNTANPKILLNLPCAIYCSHLATMSPSLKVLIPIDDEISKQRIALRLCDDVSLLLKMERTSV